MSQTSSTPGSNVDLDRNFLLLPAAGVCGGLLAIAAFAGAVALFGDAPAERSSPAVAASSVSPAAAPTVTPPHREVKPTTRATHRGDAPIFQPPVEAATEEKSVVAEEPSESPQPRFGAYQGESDTDDATSLPAASPPLEAEPVAESLVPVSPPGSTESKSLKAPAMFSALPIFQPPVIMPRREQPTEEQLRSQLLRRVPEVLPEDESVIKRFSEATLDTEKLQLLALDRQLCGLPLRMGDECKLAESAAVELGKHSTEFRRLAPALTQILNLKDIDTTSAKALREHVKSVMLEGWANADSVPSIEQILQVQEQPLRMVMIDLLREINTAESSVALARRALYDLDADVRLMAALALRERSRDEYLPTLLTGFRYPWEQVAFHAADAVVVLGDRTVVTDLVDLLDEPNPNVPFVNETGHWVVREVASINHFRNCQLCHARSVASSDPVRGLIPIPGKPLPSLYYQAQRGNFVRADRTYIKQDFSVMQPVKNAHPWPDEQRFDYVVREYQLSSLESPLAEFPFGDFEKTPCPQHDAVRYALRALTGRDAGDSAEDWRREVLRDRVSMTTTLP